LLGQGRKAIKRSIIGPPPFFQNSGKNSRKDGLTEVCQEMKELADKPF
jgi:hypothetical protein